MPLRPLVFLLLVFALPAAAQTPVRGVVADAATDESLPGATVLAVQPPDSTGTGAATDLDGAFALSLPPGEYTLRVSFVGYRMLERAIRVADQPLDLGRLALAPDTTQLADALVQRMRTRVEVRGDTTAYNADAYSVNPDASAGDLLRQLPGVTEENGAVTANGETIERVLVDGKEFFSDDPRAALESLPADAIQEVQVFDKASDQEELTGFDDGERQPTINLVTKPERRRNLFGRASAGAGTGSRYATNTRLNLFDGDRRATLTVTSDNVDAQTRAALSDDERFFGGSSGISRRTTVGLNVNDSWGDWAEVNASYSYNGYDGTWDGLLTRDYLLSEAAGQSYTESNVGDRASQRHAVRGRAELTLSERTDLRLTPSLTFRTQTNDSRLDAQTALPSGDLLSLSRTNSDGEGDDIDADLRATIGHRFETEGRSLSSSLRFQTEQESDEGEQDVERLFRSLGAVEPDSVNAFGRRVADDERQRSLRAQVTYTEPVADGYQLLLEYEPSLGLAGTDREGLLRGDSGTYTVLDSAFTSLSDRQLVAHEGRIALQRRSEAFTGTFGLGLRRERLTFEQTGLRPFRVDQTTTAFQPSARVEYEFDERSQLQLRYSASTDAPSATQLRDVVDDSNPLRISTGNPDLRTARTHWAYVTYRTADPEAGTSFSFGANGRASRDAIVNATVTTGADSATVRGIALAPGAQLTYPVNVDGAWNVFGYASHGRPITPLRSNLNLNGSVGYARSPSLLDGALIDVRSLQGHVRAFLSTTSIETLDLSLGTGATWRADLSDETRARPRSLSQWGRMEADWRPGSGAVLQARLTGSYDADRELDPLVTRLDLGLGYSFLPDDRAQVRLTISDVFDRGADVERNVTDLYVEQTESLALGRIVLLNLAYTLRQPGGSGPPGPGGRERRGRRR